MLKSEQAIKMKEEGMAEVKMPDGQTLQLPVLSVSYTCFVVSSIVQRSLILLQI